MDNLTIAFVLMVSAVGFGISGVLIGVIRQMKGE